MSERPSFHNILMNMALLVAQRSTCVRLQVGTVISAGASRIMSKNCAKRLINLGGVRKVYFLNDYRIRDSISMLASQGVEVYKYIFPVGEEPERKIVQGMT